MKKALLSLLLSLAVAALAAQPKASVKGIVTDAATGERLIGTTILVEGTPLGTASDSNGEFTISNITPGPVSIIATYLGYEIFRQDLVLKAGDNVTVEIALVSSDGISLQEVVVTAQIDNESENVALSHQRENLVAIQTVGANEMSRKGISDARSAVAQVSGISHQEGVKNVFVRGLGDRYNATFLNGFPLPSEDPEYKNIALEFFGSDIISSIGVNKVLRASSGGDVAGAVIDIRSKELTGYEEFSVSLSGGANSEALGADTFKKLDGVNYFGASRSAQPSDPTRFDFPNRLTPSTVSFPLNHSYSLSGGKRWNLGADGSNPLSFFVVASHSSDHTYSDKSVRSTDQEDHYFRDQQGSISSISINQLALANLDFRLDTRHRLTYNFMLIHSGDQYVGEYFGVNGDRYSDKDYTGFMRRQQSNDNLLLTHQLITRFNLSDRWQLNVGAAYNSIEGDEPDRRENNLSLQSDGGFTTTSSNAQERFFSTLTESDLNLKADVRWKLAPNTDIDHSNITLGYRGRFVRDRFDATEYFYGAFDLGSDRVDIDVDFDELYNPETFAAGKFRFPPAVAHDYSVSKDTHSAFIEASHRFSPRFSANVGFQLDQVDMSVTYKETTSLDKLYYLPSLSLRWDPVDRHSLRLGASQSYTLPQSKEISEYLYINIDFSSAGDRNVRPSDNLNLDLKWDWYPSSSELVSLGVFYKHIAHPIGRVDKGSSSLALTYDNISKQADVAGVEFELRKNLINTTTARQNMRRLSVGLNASYIYSSLDFDIENTAPRRESLEGASPFLLNGDLSYNWSSGSRSITTSVVVNYFSDRLHTLGTRGNNNTMEEGVVTLSLASSFKLNRHWSIRLKAGNLLNQPYRLTRDLMTSPGKATLVEYRKGIDISLGLSFEL